MVQLLHIPPHVATATSHFVLAITALTGTAVHAARGDFHDALARTIALSSGVIAGAQGGARLSTRVRGPLLVRLLALALALVGARIVAGAL
jgi:uncharacterized membrane protein YfcA